jgi:hypothetical protein
MGSLTAQRLYWFSWAFATATTGIVAGFMLGHALVLGRFLDWMLTSGRARLLAETYPAFRESSGKLGLDLFYAVAGLQIIAAICFAIISRAAGRRVVLGIVIGITAVLWPLVHYGSGFGFLEASVYRSATPVAPNVAGEFVAWNGPIHIFHAATLIVALYALLAVPFTSGGPYAARVVETPENVTRT